MKRALFFPSYFGSGFGHIGRCLLLASELRKNGWTTAMVIAGTHAAVAQNKGCQVFRPHFPSRPHPSEVGRPIYTFIVDGNIQLIRDGYTRPWRFYGAITEAMHISRRFRPDVLIGDFSLVTWVAGQRLRLPVVQIAQSISYPREPKIIWWEAPPSGVVSPDVRPVVNPVLSRWKLNEVSRVEDLLQGNLYLIPSIPELEPIPGSLEAIWYTGALIPEESDSAQRQTPTMDRAKVPLVYVTLGGGASPVNYIKLYEMINEALGYGPWRVVVSTGGKFDPLRFPSIPPNISYHHWVDGPSIIRESDLVLFHGGHGTMMETVHYGIPSVVLPFHSEQEGNGRRLEAQSAAVVLNPIKNEESCRLVRTSWKYGEFITCVQPLNLPSPETLKMTVSMVLKDHRYRAAASMLSSINAGYSGASGAAERIARLV